MTFIIGSALAFLALFIISLQRTYSRLSLAELKRRARHGDTLAGTFHKAVTYGPSLSFLLWLLVGVSCGVFFAFVAINAPVWLSISLSGLFIWLGFVWLPASKVTSFGERMAAAVAPMFATILHYLHPLIDRVIRFVRKHRPIHLHTGLYERADILDLLDKQQSQPDNRIEAFEVEIARNALTFSDKIIRDVMTPRRVVKMVSVDEEIGPVLMSELHDSGFSRFPVYGDKHDEVVGMLFLRDLVKARAGGKVRNKMHQPVLYLHEEQSLFEALQAILKTRQHLFVVVNGFEEYVGVVTMQDVMTQLLGEPILDEFDQYEDMRAVAAKAASKDHDKHVDETIEVPDMEGEDG